MDLFEIADVVRDARKAKGWTQADLARRSGVSRQLVSDFENHRIDEIGYKKMGRMCLALKLEITVSPIDKKKRAETEAIQRVKNLERSDCIVAEAMRPSVRQFGPMGNHT